MRSVRRGSLVYALTFGTIGLLITNPIVLADEDRGRGDQQHHPAMVQHADGDRDDQADRDDRDDRAGAARVSAIVAALNDQVTTLGALQLDTDNDADLDVGHIRLITLAQLEVGVSSSDATVVTTAVKANTAALQAFLQGGSANANAIDAALTQAGVSPSSVLAILSRGDRLLVVTG